ncbi:HAD family phosphatase [Isoptericola variabilis]|uniref:Beta-phosphoglucomutase family hydrolase n=1 Tax=Isoptericola variabilis (strain 225) TaxID=743718 RepID=F6FQN7_ISOV2|nr:HAD-IA family hydrolase [Isoptericola variabilis]AEG44933.1 beta-phosphoglucomutase family hydrolase [Isoptericola variabilis 225]TWH26055.1 HAD superfamily hydrolase (TIGR01509 family)/beta-phosphoglucomutase family hydrolase [Isoptericola variabilis J7]
MPGLRAVLFDLDGVLTPTAALHMRAWERLFAPWCSQQGVAPYTDADYFAHVDGRPRYDGVAAFVASRGVELPWGSPDDAPGDGSVCALGNRKDEIVNRMFAEEGIEPYPGSVRFLDAVTAAGARVAVVSSSRNTPTVLAAAGLADRFEVVVDGNVAARERLAGKPAPDTYVRAAELVGVPAGQAVVVEDAVSGVAAGRAGGFGLVVGVDRGVGAQALREHGADVVVTDLDELDASVLDHAAGEGRA